MKRKPNVTWRESFYVEAYVAARDGNTDKDIAKILGIPIDTFRIWCKRRPALGEAIEKGRSGLKRKGKGNAKEESFSDYVFRQLPEKLQRLWGRLRQLDKQKAGIEMIEELFAGQGKYARQQLFVHALVAGRRLFDFSDACRITGITKKTFDKWATEDPDFAELLDQIQWHKKNFFEGSLINLVRQGHPAVVMYANESVNSDRGYGRKSRTDVVVEGNVNVQQEIVSIDTLALPLEMKQKLLQAMRDANTKVIDVPKLPVKNDTD